MAKRTPKAPVTTTEVRAWLVANGLNGDRDRGRFGSAQVEAYNKANPTRKYKINYTPKPAKTFKVTAVVVRNGRKVPITRSVSYPQARAALGDSVGSRGRLSPENLKRAVAVLSA